MILAQEAIWLGTCACSISLKTCHMLGLLNIHTKDTPIIVMALKIILSDFCATCGVFRLFSSDQEDIAINLITNLGYSSILPDLFLRVVSADSSMLTVMCSPLESEVARKHGGIQNRNPNYGTSENLVDFFVCHVCLLWSHIWSRGFTRFLVGPGWECSWVKSVCVMCWFCHEAIHHRLYDWNSYLLLFIAMCGVFQVPAILKSFNVSQALAST